MPALVPRESLTNAVGLMSAGQNMTRVVGPSVAGIVIGTIGVGPTFLAQAVAIAASFLLVLGIVLPPRAQRTARGSGIFDGIRLVTSRPDLRSLFLLASIPTFFVFPYIGFLNVFARDILQIGAQGLGLLMAVSGCGAVVGSLLVAAAGEIRGNGAAAPRYDGPLRSAHRRRRALSHPVDHPAHALHGGDAWGGVHEWE